MKWRRVEGDGEWGLLSNAASRDEIYVFGEIRLFRRVVRHSPNAMTANSDMRILSLSLTSLFNLSPHPSF